MFERFSRSAKEAVKRAQHIAADDGARTVEAEHLLLALTRQADPPTAAALGALGLTEEVVREALDRDVARALQAVGVTARPGRPAAPPTPTKPPFGQSAKLALSRSLELVLDRGHRRIEDRHLLLAVTRAEAGVVPGVLRLLDLTPGDVERALP